jgi:hemerythrin-like metal-binding protein
MALMHWGSYLETGHRELDAQHRDLVSRINRLDPTHEGEERRDLVRLLGTVSSHTRLHFQMEETLMDQSAYPGASRHKELHRAFEGELEALIDAFQRNLPGASLEVANLLQDWNPNHIILEDRRLVEHLRASIKPPE